MYTDLKIRCAGKEEAREREIGNYEGSLHRAASVQVFLTACQRRGYMLWSPTRWLYWSFHFVSALLNIYPLGACKGHTEPYMNTVDRPPMLFLILMAPLQDEQSTIET